MRPSGKGRAGFVGHVCHQDVLDNGLKVVTVEVPHLHAAMLAVYVRFGSRHEPREHSGVAHFLEHMFFRGTRRYPDTRTMNGLVEDAGGSLNGCTLRDHGFYYTSIHPDRLQVAFDVVGDMLCAPLLKGLRVEREIILEEMRDEVDASGRDVDIDNLSKRMVFEGHPLAMKIAGTPRTVRAMTRGVLEEHLSRFVVAENMVVAVAGPVSRRRAVDGARRAFSSLRRGRPAEEAPPIRRADGPRLVFVAHEESQTELRLSFPCAPDGHPDWPALVLARRILDDGLSSWLPLHVVERRGLAYSVHAGIDTYNDAAIFELEAACTPPKAVAVVEELGRQVARLTGPLLDEGELGRIKRRHRMGLELSLDSLGDLTGWYGGTALFRPPEGFEERCREIERVDPRFLRDVARRTFTRDGLFACAIGPSGSRAIGRAVRGLDLP